MGTAKASPLSRRISTARSTVSRPTWVWHECTGTVRLSCCQLSALVSASNAWAVGFSQEPLKGSKNMILRWNGTSWTQVPSPNPFCATCDSLYGVAATSASSAWAVGTLNGGAEVVILRWNGTAWKNSPSAPLPG